MRLLALKTISIAGALLRRTPLARSDLLNRVHAAATLRLHRSSEARVGPFRVRFDPRDRFIAKKLVLYGGYETEEIALFCSLLEPGDSVLDIGANIGLYTLHLSRAVGPDGRVIAVEPDPSNVALLRANLEANECDNVTVLACAFGAESGTVKLFQVDDNRGNLSLADVRGSGRYVRVPIQRGEDALGEVGIRPTTAKIDVEGAEPLVLSGLGYKPAVLLFEFCPFQLSAMGYDGTEFLESLVADGYTLERIDPNNGARIPVTPSSAINECGRSHLDLWNILAVR